jgi:hypothetical protein
MGVVGMGILGPSKAEKAWRQFADEIGAEFVKGGPFGTDALAAYVKPWWVTFEIHKGGESGPSAEVTAHYRAKDDFWFKIYRRDWLNRLAKRLGANHIDVGDADFDRDFVVLSNDELKSRTLLANAKLLQRIQVQWSYSWPTQLRIEHKAEGSRLMASASVAEDAGQLKSMLDLFVATLNQLVDIGSAESPRPPAFPMRSRSGRP